MQCTVAFARSDINIDPVKVEVHGVQDNGPQDCAVYFWQIRGTLVDCLLHLWLVKVDNPAAGRVEL